MMDAYNWKTHYADPLEEISQFGCFRRFHVENETGEGTVIACPVLPGVQVVYNDLNMLKCSRPVPLDENVLQFSYCFEGRYECVLNRQYSYYIDAGDFCLGNAGRKESRGGFPGRRFRGLCVYLETDIFAEYYSDAITELEIDMDKIRDLAVRKPRYYVLHQQEGLDRILQGMAEGFDRKYQPLLKIKTLELLLYLSSPALTEEGETAVYLNKNQVWIAETVQKLLTEDLSRHLTIEQLAEMLDVGTTTLKHSFKMVYGCSIYQYHKVIRLDEAQRLLRETTLSVNEIAARVGYMNPAKLSTAFKTKYGIQPSVYRKNW